VDAALAKRASKYSSDDICFIVIFSRT